MARPGRGDGLDFSIQDIGDKAIVFLHTIGAGLVRPKEWNSEAKWMPIGDGVRDYLRDFEVLITGSLSGGTGDPYRLCGDLVNE